MENKLRLIMLRVFCFASTFVLLCHCNLDNCNDYRILFNQNLQLKEKSPVLFGNGIIGKVKRIEKSEGNTTVTICVNRAIKIPQESKWQAGYIKAYGTQGLRIEPSTNGKYISRSDMQIGTSIDTIVIHTAGVDSLVVNKAIEVVTDLTKSDTLKRKQD